MVKIKERLLDEVKATNQKFAEFLIENNISRIRITSIGHSIAAGYSFVRTVGPLLLRNETLEEILKNNGIEVELYHFARGQNNSDRQVHKWLQTNISETEMNKMNRVDYSNLSTAMTTHGVTEEKLNKWYPLKKEHDGRMRDLIFDNDPDIANIVVYCSGTGSFLDALTRRGTFGQQAYHGVNKDMASVNAVLESIEINNRNNNGTAQVYLSGIPNLLGIRVISNLINYKIKRVAKQFANVVYLTPAVSRMFNRRVDKEGNEAFGFGVDVHYNENEYLKFNINILKSIMKNYVKLKSLIKLDREIEKLSTEIEFINTDKWKDKEYVENRMYEIMNTILDEIKKTSDKKEFVKAAKKVIVERFPYDYYYVGKGYAKEVIKTFKNKI